MISLPILEQRAPSPPEQRKVERRTQQEPKREKIERKNQEKSLQQPQKVQEQKLKEEPKRETPVQDSPVAQVVSFTIDGSGNPVNVRLASSSGSSSMDNETFRLIRSLKFPPPPDGKPLNLRVEVEYQLRR